MSSQTFIKSKTIFESRGYPRTTFSDPTLQTLIVNPKVKTFGQTYFLVYRRTAKTIPVLDCSINKRANTDFRPCLQCKEKEQQGCDICAPGLIFEESINGRSCAGCSVGDGSKCECEEGCKICEKMTDNKTVCSICHEGYEFQQESWTCIKQIYNVKTEQDQKKMELDTVGQQNQNQITIVKQEKLISISTSKNIAPKEEQNRQKQEIQTSQKIPFKWVLVTSITICFILLAVILAVASFWLCYSKDRIDDKNKEILFQEKSQGFLKSAFLLDMGQRDLSFSESLKYEDSPHSSDLGSKKGLNFFKSDQEDRKKH